MPVFDPDPALAARDCGGFALTDLWRVDRAIADDVLAVTRLMRCATKTRPPMAPGPQFEQLVADWRPRLVDRPAFGRP